MSHVDTSFYLAQKLAQLQKSGAKTSTGANYTTVQEVAAAFANAGLTAAQHFTQFGQFEGLSPNANFDVGQYYAFKANQLNATNVAKPGGGAWTALDVELNFIQSKVSAWNHFVQFGFKEGVNPSNAFDLEAYYASKAANLNSKGSTNAGAAWTGATVKAFFISNNIEPISHFIDFGRTEGVTVTPVAANQQVAGGTNAGTSTTANPGQSFTLTSGVDTISGTTGNDTITADNSNATTLTAADSINGGAGVDTLKVFQAAATNLANTVFGQLSNVEAVEINSGTLTNTGNLNVSGLTGVTSLKVISPVAMADAASFTITGAATQTVALQQVSGTAGVATSTVTLASGLNTVGLDRVNTDITIDVAGTGNTLNVVTSGGSASAAFNSNVALTNTGAGVRTVNISGDQTVTVTTNAAVAGALTAVNASTSTAAVNLVNNAAITQGAFAFTGGSGNDSVTFANDALGTLASGASINGGAGTDKVGLFDTALSATEIARINQFQGVETLGLNANVTVDTAAITAIKSYSIDTNTTVTLSNIGAGVTSNVGITSTSLTLSPAVGTNSTAFTIGSATANTNVTLGTLVTTGLTGVSIASNGSGTGANVINTFTNSDNSNVTITGSQALTLALTVGTAGSQLNGSAATGVLTLTGFDGNDIITGGTAADVINGGSGADVMTGGAGNDTFVLATRAATKGAIFAASDTNYSNVDSIKDFVGNGAAAGDSIRVGLAANAFGGAIQFTNATTATVTKVTVATAADFTSLATAIQAASAGAASTNGTAQVYDVTVTAGNLAGRVLVINDDTAAIAATDTFVNLTGVTGDLNAQDFTFA